MTDPQPLGATIPAPLRERLEAMGVKPASQITPDPRQARETEAEKAERLAARQAVYQARWVAQVPPMYADASLDDLDESQAVSWPDDSLNLVLAGGVGTGKTHAAYALGNALSAKGTWVQAVTVVDLLAALRPDGDPSLGRAVRECQVLILDDLGANKVTDWALETMTALLDLRIREGRRTVVTTNDTEPDLEAAWGGRFMDRLRFKRTVAVFRGESRRKAAW